MESSVLKSVPSTENFNPCVLCAGRCSALTSSPSASSQSQTESSACLLMIGTCPYNSNQPSHSSAYYTNLHNDQQYQVLNQEGMSVHKVNGKSSGNRVAK